MSQLPFPELPPPTDGSEEVSNDAIQLLAVSSFNGLCRLMGALGENGLLWPHQVEDIHAAMAPPLDDPDWRDDSFVAGTRETLEVVLSYTMKQAREFADKRDEEEE